MPGRALSAVMAVAVLAAGGCAAAVTHDPAASPAASRTSSGPPRASLVEEAPQGFRYTLTALKSCEIGDALTVVGNTASGPATVTGLKLDVAHDPAAGADQTTYRVAAIAAGSNPGELASSFSLEVLRGSQLRPAVGTELSPLASSGKYYEFVAFVRVLGAHPAPWQITGVTISFTSGGRSFTTDFGQDVWLPATPRCVS